MLGGRQLGTFVRDYIPGGQLISFRHQDPAARVEATRLAMASGATGLYDATFARDGILAQVDVLERGTDGWILIDVVSSLDIQENNSRTRRSRPTSCAAAEPISAGWKSCTGLASALIAFAGPLAFLDFETVALAIDRDRAPAGGFAPSGEGPCLPSIV
jgi:hypothetical protein